MEGRRGTPDQRSKGEAQAIAAPAEPWHTSRELLERLQAERPGAYPDGQLRTLQHRLKEWRREAAHQMVFGTITTNSPDASDDFERSPLREGLNKGRRKDEGHGALLAGHSTA